MVFWCLAYCFKVHFLTFKKVWPICNIFPNIHQQQNFHELFPSLLIPLRECFSDRIVSWLRKMMKEKRAVFDISFPVLCCHDNSNLRFGSLEKLQKSTLGCVMGWRCHKFLAFGLSFWPAICFDCHLGNSSPFELSDDYSPNSTMWRGTTQLISANPQSQER